MFALDQSSPAMCNFTGSWAYYDSLQLSQSDGSISQAEFVAGQTALGLAPTCVTSLVCERVAGDKSYTATPQDATCCAAQTALVALIFTTSSTITQFTFADFMKIGRASCRERVSSPV